MNLVQNNLPFVYFQRLHHPALQMMRNRTWKKTAFLSVEINRSLISAGNKLVNNTVCSGMDPTVGAQQGFHDAGGRLAELA